ncbi:CoA transferase [Actinacidiphila sp. bgisy144]|uniref:CoA transferase n=1 Tax=Actinacidiphila sp. bgisy144 TaxID=3413791 RepID=UPI003EBCC010
MTTGVTAGAPPGPAETAAAATRGTVPPAPGTPTPPARTAGGRQEPPVTALRLAASHLRAAGCHVEPGPPGSGTAFTARAGGARASCVLSWAGPVDLPLAGEADVQAACGLAHVHGRRYGRPTALGVAYASCVAGLLAATGTLAALAAAAGRGGSTHLICKGTGARAAVTVRTSVAEAALLSVGQYLAAATAGDDGWTEPAGPGGPPFQAADGSRFELETLDPGAWLRFWTALGVDRAAAGHGWHAFGQRYATAVCPLPPALLAATACHAMPYLRRVARGTGVDVTAVAVAPRPAQAADEQPWQLRTLGEVGPAPAELGRGGAGPLDGVSVVEVCRRVQGPLAGHLLRLLGARVVRVEPPGGDPMRGMPPLAGDCSARFAALNHGKDVLEADLGTAAGRAAVRERVAAADVFLHSLAPGKDLRAGLDARSLIALRPGLVHAAASGWGGERGRRPPTGTDFPVQAWSGLAALVTPPGLPPAPSLLTLTDVLGGVACAEGAVAGLLAARLTGRGRAVTTSLLSAARLLCRPEFRTAPEEATVPACTDLAALAADPRFAPVLDHGPCVRPRGPWEFTR